MQPAPIRGGHADSGRSFSSSVDAHQPAYSNIDGKILWDFDTVRDYETVNGVKAKVGAIDGPGPTVAGGMLYVNSSYGYRGGPAGNALLAFSVDREEKWVAGCR